MVVHSVTAYLHRHAEPADGGVVIDGARVSSYSDLVDCRSSDRLSDDDTRADWAGSAVGLGTVNAFLRRLIVEHPRPGPPHPRRPVAQPPAQRQHRGQRATHRRRPAQPARPRASGSWSASRSSRSSNARRRPAPREPLLFVVLDELNKYAPRRAPPRSRRCCWTSPSAGARSASSSSAPSRPPARWSGASSSNSAIKVVGRLDPAEAGRPEYGFLPPAQLKRALIAKPGTMFINQPDIPVPLVVEFPFPAWATRPSEAGAASATSLRSQVQSDRPVRGDRRRPSGAGSGRRARPPGHSGRRDSFERQAPMKILHTSDWHIGKDPQGPVPGRGTGRGPWRDRQHRRGRTTGPGHRRRRPVRNRGADGRHQEDRRYRHSSALRRHAGAVIAIAGNHDHGGEIDALRPWADEAGVTLRGSVGKAADHLVTGVTKDGEAWRMAALPFAVPALRGTGLGDVHELSSAEAIGHLRRPRWPGWRGAHQRVRRRPETVNLAAAHLTVVGGKLGGGERDAHTIEALRGRRPWSSRVRPTTSPSATCTAVNRCSGPCPIYYSGSPLALDFGEGRTPRRCPCVETTAHTAAKVRPVPITLGAAAAPGPCGATLTELAAAKVDENAWLRGVRPGEAPGRPEGRGPGDLLPRALEVRVDTEALPALDPADQHSPHRPAGRPTSCSANIWPAAASPTRRVGDVVQRTARRRGERAMRPLQHRPAGLHGVP